MNKPRVVAIAQARMGSTRLPGKVLSYLRGKTVLHWTVDAIRAADGIDEVVVATSTLPADDAIARYCALNRINCFRGSESDVLDRFYQCAIAYAADVILRLTCDCPFLDPHVITEVVRLRAMKEADYATNTDPPTYPDGLDVECFTFNALTAAWKESTRPSDRDCVPQFIVRNRHRFPAVNLTCPLPGLAKERWVLDTEADLKFCVRLSMHLDTNKPPSYLDILRVLDIVPEIRDFNKSGIRNERFYEAINSEELPPRSFDHSGRLLRRALERIPFGAQTFSKSHLQFPPGRSPLYVSHADGARIFDVDGNDYVDLVNAILPVVLGYRDPDVDEAIHRQLDSGISFSLSTALEGELAEILCHHIPCAEMVKFGKSGTDVTTAAIRVARAYTGRDIVVMTGYHGWADWSMITTERDAGILAQISEGSERLTYGDYDRFNKWFKEMANKTAAIIVEPDEDPDFLKYLRMMCDKHGIVLIFDEVITGFRWMMGGAQKFHNVTPDLACFGKAMANGMPLSAIVGKRHIMKKFEPPDNIFYSGTMFGETLSLAASIATIKKMEREHVIQHLWDVGAKIATKVNASLDYHGLNDVIQLTGMHPRMKLNFKDHENATANQIKTLFMQNMAENGVLIAGSNNVSFAIKEPEINRIAGAYDAALMDIGLILDGGPGAIEQVIGPEIASFDPLRKS
jgi:glutamate-1-semialdehyde aminotransferase/spore coat polysaccharide biosynthesis protein SpsF (cytidylyltransferase family)